MGKRSPIKWYGGKGSFLKHLLPMVPNHRCFCEVFGGGASLLFAKSPSAMEVYNDINDDVVAFFRVFQTPEQYQLFKHKCKFTPYSRSLYKEYRDTWHLQTDPIERAYRWFIMVRMAFNGSFGKGGACFDITRSRAGVLKGIVDMFDDFVDRLRNVQIENDTWEVIIDRYDKPDVFFYLDPPYVLSVRNGEMYDHEMTDADHERLIDRVQTIQGKVLLSGYANAIYDKLDWDCVRIDKTSTPTGKARHGLDRSQFIKTECLWHNYEIQPTLF